MEIKLAREDFINEYPPSACLNKNDIKTLWDKERFNVYVHIPYCYKRCGFCYFKTQEIGHESVPEQYVQAVIKEMELYSKNPLIRAKEASSLYFGGGTPTKLTADQMERLILKAKECFNFDEQFELCFEARPGEETSEEKLLMLKKHGIQRISIGTQSLDDDILVVNKRNHNAEAFYKVYDLVRKLKIPSINVDIMSGMVNQTLESLIDTVDKVLSLKPENITIYKMEVYLNNEIYKRVRSNEITLSSNEEEASYVRKAFQKIMDAGYQAVTNFSFSIDEAHNHIHRKMVWDGEDMLGIGASARSCVNDYLFQNDINIERYMENISNGKLAVMRAYDMSTRESMIQRMVFGIKSTNYELKKFYDEFGVEATTVFARELRLMKDMGFIEINDTHIKLNLEGMIYADDIVRILYPKEQRFAYMSHAPRNNNQIA